MLMGRYECKIPPLFEVKKFVIRHESQTTQKLDKAITPEMKMGSDTSSATDALLQELVKVRLFGANKLLRPFLQRLETWELLLVVCMLSGNKTYGIEDYLARLRTLKCTRLTMRNFIRDRIAEGSFLVVDGEKKSKKSLALSAELQTELEECFSVMTRSSIFMDLATEQTQNLYRSKIDSIQ
jgi:hypothetical protein